MPGLFLTQHGWNPASVEWSHADGTETYEVTTDIHNAYAVALDLAKWLDHPARPWASSINSVEVKTREVNGRVDIYFEFTGSKPTFDYANGEDYWTLRFGEIGLTGDGTPGSGSVWADFGLANWTRWDRSSGTRMRRGSWRMGISTLAPSRPSCEAYLTSAQANILSTALSTASDPRSAYIYDDFTDSWQYVVIDKISMAHVPDDFTRVKVGIDLIGHCTAVG